MLCFHGTTLENYTKLMNGEDKPSGAWTVSDPDWFPRLHREQPHWLEGEF